MLTSLRLALAFRTTAHVVIAAIAFLVLILAPTYRAHAEPATGPAAASAAPPVKPSPPVMPAQPETRADLAAPPPAAASTVEAATPLETPPDEPPPITAKAKAEARLHFRKGLTLLRQEAWAPALAEFLLSRQLFPTRVATNNAGVALHKLQRYDEALDMFETLLRDFKVPQAQLEQTQKKLSELRGLVGTIDISRAEPGSSIIIGSVDRGGYPPVTPLRVPAGRHIVQLFKEGFEPFETRVDVAGGQIASIQAKMVRLTSAGRLRVSERTGRTLQVVVDNVVMGQSPWEGSLAIGHHVVTLRGRGKVGSQPAMAIVRAGAKTDLTLVAEDLESQLRVDPSPPGATVSIDGVDVTNGVWLGRLRKGQHKIEVRAKGFLSTTRMVQLEKGVRRRLRVELERDEDAPIWRKPARFTMDVNAGLLVVPTLGGEVADSCDSDCSAPAGLGAMTLLHGSYELGSGLGFGLEVGYLVAGQSLEGRRAAVQPNGLAGSLNSGTAKDDLRLQGFMAGATIGYRFGEAYPVALRTGAGVLFGQLRDERSGTFTPRQGAPYSTFPVVSFPSATYFYLDPTIRAGVRFAEHWELSGSVQAILLIALVQPRFDSGLEVAAASDGIGSFPDDTVMGAFVLGVAPGANLRYDFE